MHKMYVTAGKGATMYSVVVDGHVFLGGHVQMSVQMSGALNVVIDQNLVCHYPRARPKA